MSSLRTKNEKVKLVNLTGHTIVIHNARMGDAELVIPPCGKIARVDSHMVHLDDLIEYTTGIVIPVIHFGEDYAVDLPEPQPGMVFLVSKLVRMSLPLRQDLASPDSTNAECEWDGGKLKSTPKLVMNRRTE